jgi:hypothetical protein
MKKPIDKHLPEREFEGTPISKDDFQPMSVSCKYQKA